MIVNTTHNEKVGFMRKHEISVNSDILTQGQSESLLANILQVTFFFKKKLESGLKFHWLFSAM